MANSAARLRFGGGCRVVPAFIGVLVCSGCGLRSCSGVITLGVVGSEKLDKCDL